MNTFFYILQKINDPTLQLIVNRNEQLLSNNTFCSNTTISCNYNFQMSGYTFYINELIIFMHKYLIEFKNNIQVTQIEISAKAKFKALNKLIIDEFLSKEFKEYIIELFFQTQKVYHALSRFAYIWKYKKSPTVVSDDLSMFPINIIEDKLTTFILLQNNSKYLFKLNDLVSIIETALGNNVEFFSEPIIPKNPYNNIKLNISNLYNIYFKLKESPRIISHIYHLFFLSNFNITNFKINHEVFLLKNSIQKHINNSPYTLLHNPVLNMLRLNPYTCKLDIHEEFPKDILVNIFRPYLYLFYLINYYYETEQTKLAHVILYNKMMQFYHYNKLFGRKYIKLVKQDNKFVHTHHFNTKHVSFDKNIIKFNYSYNYDSVENNINLNDVKLD